MGLINSAECNLRLLRFLRKLKECLLCNLNIVITLALLNANNPDSRPVLNAQGV